jgi:hypothetical protein
MEKRVVAERYSHLDFTVAGKSNEKFVHYEQSNRSLAAKRGIKAQSVGVNDADYLVGYLNQDEVKMCCPIFSLWSKMIYRCYSKNYHKTRPTYAKHSVCNEWSSFMNYRDYIIGVNREWVSCGMKDTVWAGRCLDKDIKSMSSWDDKSPKVYSPETCLFITPELNCF